MSCQWPWTAACFIVLLAVSSARTNGCTSGFIDQDLLERRASKIGSAFPGIATTILSRSQFLVMPGMNFSCNGTITGYLVGVDVRDEIEPEVKIDLWRPQVQGGQVISYSYVTEAQIFIELIPGDFSPDGLLKYTLPAADNVQFQAGDVLGVYQNGLSGSAVRLFYTTGHPSPPLAFDVDLSYDETFTVNASGYDVFNGTVLVRPITNHDTCLNGFLSESELRQQILQVNINGVVGSPRQQRLFPDIQFTCNGLITKWIVGAQTRTSGTEMPELQIWRRTSDVDIYAKVGFSLLNHGVSNNSVIEYTLASPLKFHDEDILGIFQPQADHSKIMVYYQDGTGPENYVYDRDAAMSLATLSDEFFSEDYPLVTGEVTQVPVSTTIPGFQPSNNNTNTTIISLSVAIVAVFTIGLTIVVVIMITAVVIVLKQKAANRLHDEESTHSTVQKSYKNHCDPAPQRKINFLASETNKRNHVESTANKEETCL